MPTCTSSSHALELLEPPPTPRAVHQRLDQAVHLAELVDVRPDLVIAIAQENGRRIVFHALRTSNFLSGRSPPLDHDRRWAIRHPTKCDGGSSEHPRFPCSFSVGLLVERGMTPAQALRAGTQNASMLLGVDKKMGTLEPGKEADIVAVAVFSLANRAPPRMFEW